MSHSTPRILLILTVLLGLGCQLLVEVQRIPQDSPIVVSRSAVGEGPDVMGFPMDPDVLVRGAQIFDARCSPCHGASGRGDGPLAEVLLVKPRNYHEDQFIWGTRPSDIVNTIRSGRSNVMPSFEGELTPWEMWAVSYVVWSWIPEERRDFDIVDDSENL